MCREQDEIDKTIIVNSNSQVVTVSLGKITSGFECFDINLLVISANEIIEGEKRKRHVSSAFKQGEKVVYADLKVGDYVVHSNYGIGIFIGVNTITADGTTKDYIKIKYQGDDILYVPTNQLDSVRKYVGGDEQSLKINKLGSKDWINTKTKVKKNLREVARELIELYANITGELTFGEFYINKNGEQAEAESAYITRFETMTDEEKAIYNDYHDHYLGKDYLSYICEAERILSDYAEDNSNVHSKIDFKEQKEMLLKQKEILLSIKNEYPDVAMTLHC